VEHSTLAAMTMLALLLPTAIKLDSMQQIPATGTCPGSAPQTWRPCQWQPLPPEVQRCGASHPHLLLGYAKALDCCGACSF
jgi:hypothetical protein